MVDSPFQSSETRIAVDWSRRKVLITGADGFIGSHLAEAMVAVGADVTALALYNSFDSHGWLDDLPAKAKSALRQVRGDIRDPHQMAKLCRGRDVVFHLAALIAVPYSYDAPSSYVQTNVQGTVNVLSATREAGVSRVIHTSTSEVYGTARFTPITEDHPLQGQSPYSASKIAADMMAESFHRSFAVPVITLRPFNTYGPRQSERAVISMVIRQALDPRCDALRVGDLPPSRDFSFVADTVAGCVRQGRRVGRQAPGCGLQRRQWTHGHDRRDDRRGTHDRALRQAGNPGGPSQAPGRQRGYDPHGRRHAAPRGQRLDTRFRTSWGPGADDRMVERTHGPRPRRCGIHDLTPETSFDAKRTVDRLAGVFPTGTPLHEPEFRGNEPGVILRKQDGGIDLAPLHRRRANER